MFKITRILTLGVCLATSASAGSLLFDGISLTDNDGGNFLAGASVTIDGLRATFLLPAFTQSDFAAFSGELNLSITATYDQPWINGVLVTYYGLIDQTNGPAALDYVQTASGSPDSPGFGNLTSLPFSVSFFLNSVSSVDLTTQLDLSDNGGLASVSAVQFDVIAPEPATTIGMAAGVALLAMLRRRTNGKQ